MINKHPILKSEYSLISSLILILLGMLLLNYFESKPLNEQNVHLFSSDYINNSIKTDATDPTVENGKSYYTPLYSPTAIGGQGLSGFECHMVRKGGFQWPFCNLELPLLTPLNMNKSDHLINLVIDVDYIIGSHIFRLYLEPEDRSNDQPVYSQIVHLNKGKNLIPFSNFGLSQWWIEDKRFTTEQSYQAPMIAKRLSISTSPYMLEGGTQTIKIKAAYATQKKITQTSIRYINIVTSSNHYCTDDWANALFNLYHTPCI